MKILEVKPINKENREYVITVMIRNKRPILSLRVTFELGRHHCCYLCPFNMECKGICYRLERALQDDGKLWKSFVVNPKFFTRAPKSLYM